MSYIIYLYARNNAHLGTFTVICITLKNAYMILILLAHNDNFG